MSETPQKVSESPATGAAVLIYKSGRLAGTQRLLDAPVTRVGRSSENDVVLTGEEASIVSSKHLEIERSASGFLLRDLNSTNGTFVNHHRIREIDLQDGDEIQLGPDGPVLSFRLGASQSADLDLNRTVVAPPSFLRQEPAQAKPSNAGEYLAAHDSLLAEAVKRARMLRRTGAGDHTMLLMRDVLDKALRRSGRRFKFIIAALAVALIATTAFAGWKVHQLRREKTDIDRRIQEIQARLEKVNQGSPEADKLAEQLSEYEGQAQALQGNLLYKVGVREHETRLVREIRSLMAEFGAEVYSLPPEFVEQVDRFIQRYQGPDRPLMVRALGDARKQLRTMRRIFEQESLPPDLAYMVLVESAFEGDRSSRAGAAGLWQFTAPTARAYGLRVDGSVDERLDAVKATRASCKYIRELILDFGSGSSVMLALAAYNTGPSKVKQAVRRVKDPIKQRSFWYLYRVRALPVETREYVPKVIAAMIIGRNPEAFGF